jgi:hypothetical protein
MAWEMTKGAGTGLGHGLAIVGNTVTFGTIRPLNVHVEHTVEANRHLGYGYAQGAAVVAREAAITAATLGTAQVLRAGTAGGYAAKTVLAAKVAQPIITAREAYQTYQGGVATLNSIQNEDYVGAAFNGASTVLSGAGLYVSARPTATIVKEAASAIPYRIHIDTSSAYAPSLGGALQQIKIVPRNAPEFGGSRIGGSQPGIAGSHPPGVISPPEAVAPSSMGRAVAPANPTAYSTAFEMKLPTSVLGKRRSVHFTRANASLDQALGADAQFAKMMDDLIPGVRQAVSSVGGRQTPVGWTWEHVHSTQAGGQVGVMRLVPTYQHTPGSPWWRVIHPQPGAAGGYSEWAIPRGAPKN